MKTPTLLRPLALATLMLGVLGLSGCAIEYRCPLDPNKKPDEPTACAGMKDALAGAKAGTGGKVSVLLDDKGRLVPPEMLGGKPGKPVVSAAAKGVTNEPYVDNDDAPVFREPKVFKTWSSAFVDANGTLHDGHSSWFATPGRWAYGTTDQTATGADNLLKPASPLDAPGGSKFVQDAGPGQKKAGGPGKTVTQQQRDKNALQALSTTANSAAKRANPPAQPATATPNPTTSTGAAPGAGGTSVTQPAINLDDD